MRHKIPLWLLTLPLNVMLGVALVAASSMAQLGAGAQSWTLSAAELPPVGGQFCAQAEHGLTAKAENGDWYRCQPDGDVWRWMPTASPAPTTKAPAPTKSPTAKPSPRKTTAKPAPVNVRPTTTTDPDAPQLAKTPVAGGNLPLLAGAGVALVVAGLFIAFMLRTRRRRFEP